MLDERLLLAYKETRNCKTAACVVPKQILLKGSRRKEPYRIGLVSSEIGLKWTASIMPGSSSATVILSLLDCDIAMILAMGFFEKQFLWGAAVRPVSSCSLAPPGHVVAVVLVLLLLRLRRRLTVRINGRQIVHLDRNASAQI